MAHRTVHIARNQLDALRGVLFGAQELFRKGRGVGLAVAVPIEKYQIPRLPDILCHGIGISLFKALEPFGGILPLLHGIIRDPGIVQTECGKGGIPCTIRRSCPLAVAAVGVPCAVIRNGVVRVARMIPKLGFATASESCAQSPDNSTSLISGSQSAGVWRSADGSA